MMVRSLRGVAVLAALTLSAFVAVLQPVAPHPSIDVVASNWKFTPSTITLHVGQTTTLRLTSASGVHGLKSDDLGIPLTTIEPGKFVTVDVTPKKAGTYVLPCAIMCGPGHADMKLTVKVVAGGGE